MDGGNQMRMGQQKDILHYALMHSWLNKIFRLGEIWR